MQKTSAILLAIILLATNVHGAETKWYSGDEHCQPPKDDGTYSAPYDAKDNAHDYPVFYGADKPGWYCSYQREDGVIVQYGDSRTPQQQWLDLWGGGEGNNEK